jgi:hypothetical protein
MTKFYIQVHTATPIQFAAMCRNEDHAADIAHAIAAAYGNEHWDVERARDFEISRLAPIA